MSSEPDPQQTSNAPPAAAPLVVCPVCGAENQPLAAKCWICQQPLQAATGVAAPVMRVTPSPQFAAPRSSILPNTLFALAAAALLVMGIGVYTVKPIWLIYYVPLFCLPLLTMAGGLRYALLSTDKNVRQTGEILTPIYAAAFAILGSLGVVFLTLAAVVILVISIFVSLGELCFSVSDTGN
ncbi:hypothetical protein [Blastopirellula marina]|uniref:Uncharacterized protein n=1 Tax=Blastopirellula marina TaxID=124 RepID=A0A2S8GKW2_9BACT|nr:hypothetical protein [Blastopirellula marina]PQO44654.1 hypothetical protein C5Y93_17950 [Blastopirellula marina]